MNSKLHKLPISMADLERWELASLRFGSVPELLLSILDLRGDPNKLRATHAARVARYAASTTSEPARGVALDLAEELEQLAA